MKENFNKEEFLKEGLSGFLEYCETVLKTKNCEPEFVDALEKVINLAFHKYDPESILEIIKYEPLILESNYEFDELNFSDYFNENSFIKNYKDALAYYSLNHLFLETYEKFLDEKIKKMCNE